jgi:hypothetical protein
VGGGLGVLVEADGGLCITVVCEEETLNTKGIL